MTDTVAEIDLLINRFTSCLDVCGCVFKAHFVGWFSFFLLLLLDSVLQTRVLKSVRFKLHGLKRHMFEFKHKRAIRNIKDTNFNAVTSEKGLLHMNWMAASAPIVLAGRR